MNSAQIELVKTTWSIVLIKSPIAGEIFYERLFEIAPEIKPLFNENTKVQAQKLVNMVTLIVAKLNKLEDLQNEIKYLSLRHVNYKVETKHFAYVGDALIYTLKKLLEEKWNAETQKAWEDVYKLLSGTMIGVMAANKK